MTPYPGRERSNVLKTALGGYQRLGMAPMVARIRLVIAEALLALHRNSDAEAEIRAAMPALEEARLGPESLAAVAILRECLRRRKADPRSAAELREQQQKEQ